MSELAQESAQRKQAGRRASALLDAEQASRISAVKAEEDVAKAERVSNQRRASAMMDLEQAARVQKMKLEEEMDGIERKSNQVSAGGCGGLEYPRKDLLRCQLILSSSLSLLLAYLSRPHLTYSQSHVNPHPPPPLP